MFVFRRGFQVGFRALFAFWVCVSGVGFGLSLSFGLGFCWLFSIYWFQFRLIIFLLFFFCFSNLGFAHISTRFFLVIIFFCSSSLVLDGFWS